MHLKKKTKENTLLPKLNKLLFIYFILTLVFIGFLFTIILTSDLFKREKVKRINYLYEGGRIEYLFLPKIVYGAFKGFFHDVKKIDIEIKFKDSSIIENVRKQAISNGRLDTENKKKLIKVDILEGKKKYQADLRLKGDRKIHFEDKDKSSYKLELDKNQYLYNLKKFSLQKPRARNYIHEWLFHEISKDFDLITIKYDFIKLSINGENKGLYVIEEGFGKELIERNKRRNGPIFGLNEDVSLLNSVANIENPIFEIYNKKYWNRDENIDLVNNASQKLRNFFENGAPLEDTFDTEKWAAFFAVIDLTANYHGAFLKSVKLYYNPLNGLFEPIPFDGHRLKPNFYENNTRYDNRILIDFIDSPADNKERTGYLWLKKFFYTDTGEINDSFYTLYSDKLNIISSSKYINKFLNKNKKLINKINQLIYADYFLYDDGSSYGMGLYYFSFSDFLHSANNIKKKILNHKKITVIKKKDATFLIKNYTKNYGKLIIDEAICYEDNKKKTLKINKEVKNFSNTSFIIPKLTNSGIKCSEINFVNKYNNISFRVKIDYINSYYKFVNYKDLNQKNIKKYFIYKNNFLELAKKETIIEENIYIPKGYRVIVEPGQKLILTNNAFVISNSPWTIGGKNKKTVITGLKENLGGGIFIGDTNDISKIENTNFSYLKGYDFKANSELILFGALNIHQTKVQIDNVNFKNIFSEDAINIFKSDFKIDNSKFENIYSDAIDIDFSNGKINFVDFINIKNDAMDFSGSNVKIYNSILKNIDDKIISGGEKSIIYASKISATDSKFGIVSKDGSNVYTNEINFDKVDIPFAAYQKKNEYEKPSLIANDFNINRFSLKFLKDKNSTIILNDITQFNKEDTEAKILEINKNG
tara:strand:+ start:1012 stop:3633 length:2622 start_codon:yes stop_codon:yes gene_type:complete